MSAGHWNVMLRSGRTIVIKALFWELKRGRYVFSNGGSSVAADFAEGEVLAIIDREAVQT